jgi:hypothetical protein
MEFGGTAQVVWIFVVIAALVVVVFFKRNRPPGS